MFKQFLNFKSLNNKVIVGFLIGFLMIIALFAFSIKNNNQLIEANSRISHTQEVIINVESLLNDILIIESSNRGYVFGGNKTFIENVAESKTQVKEAITKIKELISDNPEQVLLVEKLEPLIKEKIEFGDLIIQIYSKKGKAAAAELINTERGRLIMREIKSIGQIIESNEQELLKERLANANNLAAASVINQAVTFAFALIVITLSVFFLFKESKQKSILLQEIKENERTLSQFLDTMAQGVLVFSNEGRLIYGNSAIPTLFGRSFDIGSKAEDIFLIIQSQQKNDEKLDWSANPVSKTINSKVVASTDLKFNIGIDTSYFNVQSAPILKDDTKEIEFIVVTLYDVSHRIKAQEAMQIAMEMSDNSLKVKENFLANMSHEIRTPMNSIIGFANLLEQSALDDEQKDFLGSIKTAGNNLLIIINDILDFSKIESGMLTIERIPFSLEQLIDSVRAMLTPKASEKKLELTVENHAYLPEIVIGDPYRLTQILINLVSNAIKFTKKGHVLIETNIVFDTPESIEVEILVNDTGIGISNTKLKSIFDRFVQANDSNSREFGGTGLGLSIVQNLVQLHGGTIEVESKEFVGSTFKITIPFFKPTESELEQFNTLQDIDDDEKLTDISILIVEDNPLNYKLASKWLRTQDAKIDIATNGKLAIDKIRHEGPYDIILMDIQMPEMDGYEATKIIRTNLKNPIPIIAMTAHALTGERDKCIELGMNDYISKPFKHKELFNKIVALVKKTSPEILNQTIKDELADIVNFEYIIDMSSGDVGFIKEMIDTFIAQSIPIVKELHLACQSNDIKRCFQLSHKLKSSTSILGLKKLNKLVTSIESASIDKNEVLVTEFISQLNSTLNITIKALEESEYFKV